MIQRVLSRQTDQVIAFDVRHGVPGGGGLEGWLVQLAVGEGKKINCWTIFRKYVIGRFVSLRPA